MKHRFTKRFSFCFLTLLIAFSSMSVTAQELSIEGNIENGESLFNSNCASCHKLDKKSIGPALGGMTSRRDMEWLMAWIKDNQALRASGDPDAKAIFEEYNGSIMPGFPQLSDQNIKDIIAYTAAEPAAPVAGPDPLSGNENVATGGDDDNTVLLIILGGILALLIFLLARVKNTLKQVKGMPTYTLAEETSMMTRAAMKNARVITVLTIVIAIVFFQQLYVGLMGVGMYEGYEPAQPIRYSHKLHAGDNQIDCNYCHYAARKGKHANIPHAGVCMNCHMSISEGPQYGTEEIAKIYDAVGWDPQELKYIEGYKEKPVKWVRIHNLPDLVYFNHSQHVVAGQLDCQTCHGPIQEMEEVYQYSSLTMGWCINCHRETKVQTESNDYYQEMHEQLKAKYGADAEITVEMIGGLECGKCHY